MDLLAEDTLLIKNFIASEAATHLFTQIYEQTTWHTQVRSAEDGTLVPLKRAMAYASEPVRDYHYAKLVLPGQGWSESLLVIKDNLEARTDYSFNSVLLNLYRHGRDIIQWHSDKEAQLGPNPVIATINLGASRHFHFRNLESGEKASMLLENGDLLLMLENCQQHFVHAILKESDVTEPRISLTFRHVYH